MTVVLFDYCIFLLLCEIVNEQLHWYGKKFMLSRQRENKVMDDLFKTW